MPFFDLQGFFLAQMDEEDPGRELADPGLVGIIAVKQK